MINKTKYFFMSPSPCPPLRTLLQRAIKIYMLAHVATPSIPERATILFPGLGLMGLAGVRRKVQK
jgi:hypothetical protein